VALPDSAANYSAIPTEPPEARQGSHSSSVDELRRSVSKKEYHKTHWERYLEGAFTIVPEHNRYLDIWDVIVIGALFVTALALPFEVAFFTETPYSFWVAARFVDCVFFIDIFVTFNVAFAVSHTLTSDIYERAPLKIARNYMAFPFSNGFTAGWFWADMVTIIPWDHISTGLFSVRLIRILRLLRMFRLVRVIKLLERWHARCGFSYAFTNIASCMGLTLLLLHWLACIWGPYPSSQSQNRRRG
jgi:hypothetical protein